LNQATNSDRTVEKLLRQQAALASFGAFAFRETDLAEILAEAARVCAFCLDVPISKICRYRPAQNDLLIEAGCGWKLGVVGRVISQANESSPQGRAYVTGEPVIIRNLQEANNLELPSFYPEHGIISTVDVVIPATDGAAYGVLEVDSPTQHQYDVHDINFLTGFANVLAEAVSTATKNQAIRELLAEKNLLAEELNHRVRNNLQMVTGMLNSFSRTTTDEKARKGLGAIVRRVTTLAQVYDSLLGVGLSRTIDLGDYLNTLCASLPDLQDAREQRVELVCRTVPMQLELNKVTAIGMVVAELVTNSYGHAFPARSGTITVTLTRPNGVGSAILKIEDDGIGFVTTGESSRHGLGLVKRLMTQAQGTLEVHSVDGTHWTMIFPVADTAPALKPAA
jgi:two-component sensor histidine kinase